MLILDILQPILKVLIDVMSELASSGVRIV